MRASGETAPVEAIVENERLSDASFEVTLYVDDEAVDSQGPYVMATDSADLAIGPPPNS